MELTKGGKKMAYFLTFKVAFLMKINLDSQFVKFKIAVVYVKILHQIIHLSRVISLSFLSIHLYQQINSMLKARLDLLWCGWSS